MEGEIRLAGIWTVFDSLELLRGSVDQIKDHLDEVIICYQDRGNFGSIDIGVRSYIESILAGIDYKIIKFDPDTGAGSHPNQKAKLTMALKYARSIGCTHYLYSATDEYYDHKKFVAAKQYIVKFKIMTSACSIYTYFKYPTEQLFPMENYYVPFICYIPKEIKFHRAEYPVRVDPSRCVTPAFKFRSFPIEELAMHHFSWVRENIRSKFLNHSMKIRYNTNDLEREFSKWEPGMPLPFFKKFVTKSVENKFNIYVQNNR